MRLIKIDEVVKKAGWQKTKIYAMINEGRFPKPIKQGRYSRWLESDIDNWISEVSEEKKN